MRADDIARARSAAALGVPVPAPLVVALLDHIAALESAAVRLRAEERERCSRVCQQRSDLCATRRDAARGVSNREADKWTWRHAEAKRLAAAILAPTDRHPTDAHAIADERPCCPRAPGAEHKMSCPTRKGCPYGCRPGAVRLGCPHHGRQGLTLPVVVGGGGRELRDDAHDLADDGEHWPNCACARCCLEAREGEGVRDDG